MYLNHLLRKIKFYERGAETAEGTNSVLSYKYIISHSCTCMSAESRCREEQIWAEFDQSTSAGSWISKIWFCVSLTEIHLHSQCIMAETLMLLINFSFINYYL